MSGFHQSILFLHSQSLSLYPLRFSQNDKKSGKTGIISHQFILSLDMLHHGTVIILFIKKVCTVRNFTQSKWSCFSVGISFVRFTTVIRNLFTISVGFWASTVQNISPNRANGNRKIDKNKTLNPNDSYS